MNEIKRLFIEHENAPFPDRRGDEIKGIDLVLIDSDSAGLIGKYINSKGKLSSTEMDLLTQCYSELKIIVIELRSEDRLYFERLQKIVGLIIER